MAGERIGKAYEVVVKIACELMLHEHYPNYSLFWNAKPANMTIEPDFTIGLTIENPAVFFLVTHSGAITNSQMKFWRNIGELQEAKTRLKSIPRVYSIIFDAVMKDNLLVLQKTVFDGQLVVCNQVYWDAINQWLRDNVSNLPNSDSGRYDYILQGYHECKPFQEAITQFACDLAKLTCHTNSQMSELWMTERKRNVKFNATPKMTFFRRGLTKALLLGTTKEKLSTSDGKKKKWAELLGLISPMIGGYRIVDNDLLWLIHHGLCIPDIEELKAVCCTEGFLKQMQTVRAVSLIDEYSKYVINNLAELKQPAGMQKHLLALHSNPISSIQIADGVDSPTSVWLFGYIGALVKAMNNTTRPFGYPQLATHANAQRESIGNQSIGDWCSRWMTGFVNRRPGFNPPDSAITFFSEVLSEQLINIEPDDIIKCRGSLLAEYISKEYESTLLSHRGFDPLGGLLQISTGFNCSDKFYVPSAFAEYANLGNGTGTTPGIIVSHTFIHWQSVTDAGRDHKKKELCGRAVSARYSWDTSKGAYIQRDPIQKMILLLDGTWRQKDLDALIASGWDEIYYPDEIDRLKAAIV